MIRIEFTTAIAVFLSGVLLIVFGHWLFYTVYRRSQHKDQKVWQCPFCAGMYTDDFSGDIFKCPRCGSLLDGDSDMQCRKGKEMKS